MVACMCQSNLQIYPSPTVLNQHQADADMTEAP